MGQNASPPAQNGLKPLVSASQVVSEHLCETIVSSLRGAWWIHRPHCARPRLSSGPSKGRGLGVSSSNFEGWKPQKVGVCGWTRCPRNLGLSHVAQYMASSRFWGLLTQNVLNLGHF